ncbi:MAG: hypothetical protein ACI8UO_004572 [Verrucomicrobiales bacterium]|jgi:hypothetical protein
MVFVTTADGSKGIDAITYDSLKNDMRNAVRSLRDTLKTTDVLGGESASAEVETAEEPVNAILADTQAWTNAEGTTITAAIRTVNDGEVEFIMANGNSVRYPLEKLSTESQTKIAELQAP